MWFAPLLLLAGGFTAGIMDSVAGGGSLIIYPILIALGIPPIIANASTGVTVLPGILSSTYGYRSHLRKLPARYYFVILPAMLGGFVGASILRITTDQLFSQVVPWFLLFGLSLIVVQPAVMKWAQKKRGHHRRNKAHAIILLSLASFAISIYGGYFGAGFAIVLLAFLGFTELKDIHEINGYKCLVSAMVTLTSSVYLLCYGLVQWEALPWLIIGNILGGYVGAVYSTRLPKKLIRVIILVIGLAVTIALFIKT